MGGNVKDGFCWIEMCCVIKEEAGRGFFNSWWNAEGTLGKAMGVVDKLSSSMSSSKLSSPSAEMKIINGDDLH